MDGICDFCGDPREVQRRRKDKKLICTTCREKQYQRPKGICSGCTNNRALSYLSKDGKKICYVCYRSGRPKEECAHCGKMRVPDKRVTIPERQIVDGAVCHYCYGKYYQPKYKCAICGKDRPVNRWSKLKEAFCRICNSSYNAGP